MSRLRIDSIRVGPRFRQDLGDVAVLAESIRAVGLLHPVVVSSDGLLIAGRRRLEASRLLGWTDLPVSVVDLKDVTRAEHDENLVRKDFLPSEMVAIARALEPTERTAAKQRLQEAGRLGGEGSGKLPEASRGRKRDKVAIYTGVSGRTLEKAMAVVDAAERAPDKFAGLVEEMDRTNRVDGAFHKLIVAKRAEHIQAEPVPLPEGPFRVIVADPPWSYEKRTSDPSHRGRCPYPPMTLEEIKKLDVGRLACEDCVLWLWTTNAHLPDAFDALRVWHFEYKTILTWIKTRMGTGDWLRGKTEHCLLAVRGRPTITLTNQTTALNAPAREHSRKPEEFYELVESLCPGSKVELFARNQRRGWVAHGNETHLFGGQAGGE